MRHYPRVLGWVVLLACAQVTSAAAQGVREVTMSDRSVVSVALRVRLFTTIVLPDPDDVVKRAACGDPDFWIVEHGDNEVWVKPAKEGANTNLGIQTASGRSYTFMLKEGKVPADVKIFVRADPNQPTGAPRWYPAPQVDTLHAELAHVRAAVDAERQRADDAIKTFREQYPTRLMFDYRSPDNKPPFHIRALWHDGLFTYVRSDARELPTVYELVDGKPSLLNFQVRPGGLYVMPKVVDRGYFAIGKKRWTFERR